MEKRSDISRDSFRPEQGYTSVRLQQGRPQLDADWNEQWAIQTRALRSAFVDLVGRHGQHDADGSVERDPRSGFEIGVPGDGSGREHAPLTHPIEVAGDAPRVVVAGEHTRMVRPVGGLAGTDADAAPAGVGEGAQRP